MSMGKYYRPRPYHYSTIHLEGGYKRVVKELTKDLEGFGIRVTYSMKMIMDEIAVIEYILRNIKTHLGNIPVVVEKQKIVLSSIDCGRYMEKKRYNYEDRTIGRTVYSLYYEDLLKMQKRLVYLLNELGLSPKQQIKIRIVEKLKQQLVKMENNGKSYEADIVCEKETQL